MSERFGAITTQAGVLTLDWDAGTADEGQWELQGATTVRGEIYDLLFGHVGVAGDNVIKWEVGRVTTTLSTGTVVAPVNLDDDGVAALSAVDDDLTTIAGEVAASQMLEVVLNQRATFRWVAAPGGEIRNVAVATSGVMCLPSSAGYTAESNSTLHWKE